MRVAIPGDIKRLIEEQRAHGDFVLISKRLTKTEASPEGDESRAYEVSTAVKNGAGDAEVVKEIAEYYREKQKVVQEINSI